jgi:hypothetical protein
MRRVRASRNGLLDLHQIRYVRQSKSNRSIRRSEAIRESLRKPGCRRAGYAGEPPHRVANEQREIHGRNRPSVKRQYRLQSDDEHHGVAKVPVGVDESVVTMIVAEVQQR